DAAARRLEVAAIVEDRLGAERPGGGGHLREGAMPVGRDVEREVRDGEAGALDEDRGGEGASGGEAAGGDEARDERRRDGGAVDEAGGAGAESHLPAVVAEALRGAGGLGRAHPALDGDAAREEPLVGLDDDAGPGVGDRAGATHRDVLGPLEAPAA